ncbi:DUF5989 family protein [Sphingomonas lycopersici]|uniref:DUF5989 family protein n=1 Tax=Sphingomonas lycopersici TaxID=2951807 RepID=A0AA41ZD50_9SPHN|nr:DUF5989 family protein [Sphingomonas lycopersici]MCW6536956.1 DUF5989 family protein [Sphingomonas lycopersici]
MIRKRGKLARQLIIVGSAFGTSANLVKSSARPGSRRWWLTPLIIFLCLNGLLLALVAGVEVLAPFVYAIF